MDIIIAIVRHFVDSIVGTVWKFILQTLQIIFMGRSLLWVREEKQILPSFKYLTIACIYNLMVFKFFNTGEQANILNSFILALKKKECGGVDKIEQSLPKFISLVSQFDYIRDVSMTIILPILMYIVFSATLSVVLSDKFKSYSKNISGYLVGLYFIVPGMIFNVTKWGQESFVLLICINLIGCGAFTALVFLRIKTAIDESFGNRSKAVLAILFCFMLFSNMPGVFMFFAKGYSQVQTAILCYPLMTDKAKQVE